VAIKNCKGSGAWSYTTFYIVFNVLLIFGLVAKVVRSRIE
jgi:hypothetical protein